MLVLTIIVLAIALVVAVLFVAVTLGIRQAHAVDRAQPHPTCLAALAGWVVALYVHRGEPKTPAASPAEYDRATE